MLRRTIFRQAKKAVDGAKAAAAAPAVTAGYPIGSPKMLSNSDVGGKTTYEIQKDMTENEIVNWERDWIQNNLPVQNQQSLNDYYTATQAPGFNGGQWRLPTDNFLWQYDGVYSQWYSQQYLIGAGRNPGGYPFWGVIEWLKINAYEGWRFRRNMWKLATWTTHIMVWVYFRDLIWDPTKEKGIEGYIERTREGKFRWWFGGAIVIPYEIMFGLIHVPWGSFLSPGAM